MKLGTDKLKAIHDKLKTDAPKTVEIKKQIMPREEYKEILDLVRRKFSKAFPRAVDPVKILKRGIHIDISQKLDIEEDVINRFLYVYVRKKKYMLGLKSGVSRYDLKGSVTSHVFIEESNDSPKKKQNKTPKLP